MPNITTSFKPKDTVELEGSTTPTVYNLVSPATPGDEFSQALTSGTKKLLIRPRGNANLQFTFTSGETGTKFITVKAGSVYADDGLNLTGTTLYLQCDKATHTVEVLEWT